MAARMAAGMRTGPGAADGEAVKIPGFGSFVPRHKGPRDDHQKARIFDHLA